MIVSHSHKFIFIKTKKTAGTSIEIALSKICGEFDIITPINKKDEILRNKITGKRAQNYTIPFSKYKWNDWLRFLKHRKRRIYYNHMPASEVKKHVNAQVWNTYYKFCFERHPVDKCVSHYKWKSKKKKYPDFETYLKSEDPKLIQGAHFYKSKQGKLLVDTVYKMENIEEAFVDISNKIGLKSGELKVPSFRAKDSAHIQTEINKTEIEKKFSSILKRLFKTEYDDIYHEY